MTRIAVLDRDKCKSKRCGNMCYRFCPMVRSRIEAIRFEENKPIIVESLCTGCGICIKKCPFKAIEIINLPNELEKDCTHRFGENTFKLYRLPTPSQGMVLGLLGPNGIGKTITLKILSGKIKLNLGNYRKIPKWDEIIEYFRGSTLQSYFRKLSNKETKISHKPQYVDKIPRFVAGKVKNLLKEADERNKLDEISDKLEIKKFWNRPIEVLSGGELQRVAIATAICKEAEVYLFDEPSSYLDVKQRLEVAKIIRDLKKQGKTILVVEHDLAIIDYLSDQICVFYGKTGVYGVISNVHGVRTGINIYLQGYIPDENMRFRKESIIFHEKPPTINFGSKEILLKWNRIEKKYEEFNLLAHQGEINRGEIIGILGPNGIGKTTFVKILAGIEKIKSTLETKDLKVNYKPQYISTESSATVSEVLKNAAKENFALSWYKTEIIKPLTIEPLLDRKLEGLSGGELQKVAIAVCLSKKADLYLFDEPSAYLDVEERLNMIRTIRRVIEKYNVSAFVVEHDVVAQDFISDRIMVFTGEPGLEGIANSPMSLREGMNLFLKEMKVTFRRDPTTKRPRVNKEKSKLDRLQKQIGEYYYTKISKIDK